MFDFCPLPIGVNRRFTAYILFYSSADNRLRCLSNNKFDMKINGVILFIHNTQKPLPDLGLKIVHRCGHRQVVLG